MSTIDHAARAIEALDRIPGLHGEPSEFMALAQVHATLALVAAQDRATEQARIANLIALAMVGVTIPDFSPDPATVSAWNAIITDATPSGLHLDIAAALKIGDPE